jgi:hypothetical protein
MVKQFILFLLVALTSTASAQTGEADVKTVVNNVFIAMKNNDTSLLANCFSQGAILQTIVQKKDSILVKTESIQAFVSSIGKAAKGALDERIVFDVLKIDGALASVWTPYSFYYNGSFSHCGVNSFQLVNTAAGWKIQYLIDTRRKEPCL